MQSDRVSQTALKVALNLITLNQKGDWAERLPEGLAELSEKLILAAELPIYGPRIMAMSKQRWMMSAYALGDLVMPGQFKGFGHRKCFVNEQVLAAIEVGIRQVVVLGAGFDTLALRLGTHFPKVQFFEVDHPSTSVAKRKGVAKLGQPDNVTLISADLTEAKLSKVILEEGRWNAAAPAVLVAEGLFQYLRTDDVRGLLREAAACTAPRSRFLFTHCLPDWSASLAGRIGRCLVRWVGEPFLSSVASKDLPEYIHGTGWQIISDPDEDARHGIERYAVAERVPLTNVE